MVECIQKQGGMLDKFIGDAIMAVFGLPFPREDDEDRAVRAAVSMITELRHWNQQRAAFGKVAGRHRHRHQYRQGGVGEYRVPQTDGLYDHRRRRESRIQARRRVQAIPHAHPDHRDTLRELRGTYRMREVDRVVVKGKQEPVPIYEILDYHDEATFPNLMEAVNAFKSGSTYYRSRQRDKAIDGFERRPS